MPHIYLKTINVADVLQPGNLVAWLLVGLIAGALATRARLRLCGCGQCHRRNHWLLDRCIDSALEWRCDTSAAACLSHSYCSILKPDRERVQTLSLHRTSA